MPELLLGAIGSLAEIRGTTPEDIEATVERNFRRFVGADPHLPAACGTTLERSVPDV